MKLLERKKRVKYWRCRDVDVECKGEGGNQAKIWVAPWKELGGILFPFIFIQLFIYSSIHLFSTLFINSNSIHSNSSYCFLFTWILSNLVRVKRNNRKHCTPYTTHYTLHTHHGPLRRVNLKQFPAFSSLTANSHVTAKVHRALPKALENPSTHQDFVSGAAAGQRTGHGPSQWKHRQWD